MGKTRSTAGAASAMDWAEVRRNDPTHRDEIETMLAAMNLEQDLLALREEAGLTQVQLAERSGIPQSVISRMENGRAKNLELRTLVKIAAALGTRVRVSFERNKTAGVAKTGKRKRAAA